MKLTFLSVGKDRSGLFAPGVQEYTTRLQHWAQVQVVELPEAKAHGAQAKMQEGATLISKLRPKDTLVALDERGKTFSSVAFSQWIERQLPSGRDLAFAIGGDEGLSDEVRERAALVLSLSAMTMPHRLARLVLVEQVYRAFSILRGEPYHRV